LTLSTLLHYSLILKCNKLTPPQVYTQ
jgi:hypothetical protein